MTANTVSPELTLSQITIFDVYSESAAVVVVGLGFRLEVCVWSEYVGWAGSDAVVWQAGCVH